MGSAAAESRCWTDETDHCVHPAGGSRYSLAASRAGYFLDDELFSVCTVDRAHNAASTRPDASATKAIRFHPHPLSAVAMASVGGTAAPFTATGAIKRYPRRCRVSIAQGVSAESPKAARSLPIAMFTAWSKSPKDSLGQIRRRSSSREPALRGAPQALPGP